MGTRQAIAGVAAHRTVIASIVNEPVLLTQIVYSFSRFKYRSSRLWMQ
jgi:hypothetical protein